MGKARIGRVTCWGLAVGALFGAVVWLQPTASISKNLTAAPSLGSPDHCAKYSGIPAGFGSDPYAGMAAIAGGVFQPGSTEGYPEERPGGDVKVSPFWMDRTEVTNAQFGLFIKATGYVTDAERDGGAAVFKAPASATQVGRDGDWWHYMRGADWRHPEGPGSHLQGRESEPVVLVTQADAQAYAQWLGRRLPTEAQWEFAARGAGSAEQLEREPRNPDGKPLANYWQGIFPFLNSREDGFASRSPVGCYPANGYGLFDVIGNVWEWTTDGFSGTEQGHGTGDAFSSVETSGGHQRRGTPMVIKGGSFLCSQDYCVRYRTAARFPQEENLGTSHVGFRTVR